jgi:hypothetical protein
VLILPSENLFYLVELNCPRFVTLEFHHLVGVKYSSYSHSLHNYKLIINVIIVCFVDRNLYSVLIIILVDDMVF